MLSGPCIGWSRPGISQGREDLSARAKAANDARIAADEQTRKDEAAERSRIKDAGIKFLEENVLPHLEKAKNAFKQQTGAEAKIDKQYDAYRRDEGPSLSFKFIVHVRKSDGPIFESLPVFFSSDGINTRVGKGKFACSDRPEEAIGATSGEELQALIEKAVEIAFNSYFDERRQHSSVSNT